MILNNNKQTQLILMLIIFIIIMYFLLFNFNTNLNLNLNTNLNVQQINLETFENNNNNNSNSNNSKKEVLNCYLFYAYNCAHSQKLLKSHWKTLNEKYSNKIVFNKIDSLHPNTKEISKKFKIKEVTAIIIFKDSDVLNNNNNNIVEFKGERTLANLENFIIKQLNINELNKSNENFVDTKLNTVKEDIINDVEFYHNEDLNKEEYQYSIKYKDPEKSQYNLSQTINEKNSRLKSWQGSYTVISEYIRYNTKTLKDKKDLAFKIKDKIAEWHLCDPDILNIIKKNISTMENNQEDLDINEAIRFACGF